jgi:hypothetical protein
LDLNIIFAIRLFRVMPHTAGKRLVEVIRKQLERIEYFSAAGNISPNVAVHEIRKTFKRLRALLRFYSGFPIEFPLDFNTQIKYFGRSLTTIRESYVNLLIFERITVKNDLISEKKIKAAREKLVEKNRGIIETGFLKAESYQTIQNFVKGLEEKIVSTGFEIPAQLQFATQLADSYQLLLSFSISFRSVRPGIIA